MTGLSPIPAWTYWQCAGCLRIHPAGRATPGPCTTCGTDAWTSPPKPLTNDEDEALG